jgi:hypothetical protein
MNVQTFAFIVGLVFVLVGVAGFVPGLLTMHDQTHPLMVEQGAGELVGLFAVNVVHNIVHIAFGVWGLLVARNVDASIVYARSVAIVYAARVIMGLIPRLDTVFGLVPLHGNDVWLHALLAAVAAYFGFVSHHEAGHAPRPAQHT